jgi:hypothetical protein
MSQSDTARIVVISPQHVGCKGAPSRRTVFVRGTSAEQREFPGYCWEEHEG